MSLTKMSAQLGRLALVACVALAIGSSAKADVLGGLTVRAGIWTPSSNESRSVVDFGAFSLGLQYELGFVPQVLNGESWSTSISADFHYSARKVGVVRYVPVSINQVYTFEEQSGKLPYLGFCVTAATMGITDGSFQPTVTRLGGGLIAGLKMSDKLYVETRYEWIDKHGASWNVDGFRTYVGLKF
ncbi:MAG: hypothetical protein FJX72_16715 [Armatimonadetes bacterium]|nr:hypothetical protein [Armatimonadota bacterium]